MLSTVCKLMFWLWFANGLFLGATGSHSKATYCIAMAIVNYQLAYVEQEKALVKKLLKRIKRRVG